MISKFNSSLCLVFIGIPVLVGGAELPKGEGRKAIWGSGPPGAELIVKGVQSQVFRFVDEVDGKRFVCYFTEVVSSAAGGATSPLNCLPLK